MARESSRPGHGHRHSSREPGSRQQHNKQKTSASEEGRSAGTSHMLSSDALAQLNRANARRSTQHVPVERRQGAKQGKKDRGREGERKRQRKRRAVSGAIVEEGRGSRGLGDLRGLRGGARSRGYDGLEKEDLYEGSEPQTRTNRKRLYIYVGIGLVVLILVVVVAVVVSKKNSGDGNNSSAGTGGASSGLDGVVVPAGAPSWLDPHAWADVTDFNLTYTDAMVGELPIMGLNSTWDDSAAANQYVPALNQPWGPYASRPARGVNIGGWLSLEPFITPSLFDYDRGLGIIDEYTLCAFLGSSCAATLERHYATFVTESTFREIADAGLDHVRIPYSYWAVQTYAGDPYVFRTSWRYLLRGIEWARKYGLRVNLDLHGLPGSQNGWNHSGRQGPIAWFNGTDGTLNAQRSLDLHDRLSQFFAQPRYAHVISHYGLVNEPRMTYLSVPDVLNWTTTAYTLVRRNGLANATVVFGDGFRGLANWQGELQGLDNLALDVHQYVIFNTNQIVYNHSEKVAYACAGWTQQTQESMDTATGFGPTLVAEWSQADTDCAKDLTNVGWGNRWTGTYVTGNSSLDITTPRCPTTDSQCDCDQANAPASAWSDTYKQFLLMFAEAQMTSFEKGWGWWYWVWDTESAPQWSYKQGMAAGILPPKAYQKSFDCSSAIPSFSDLPEYY